MKECVLARIGYVVRRRTKVSRNSYLKKFYGAAPICGRRGMRGQLVQGPLYLVPALGAIDVEEQVNK